MINLTGFNKQIDETKQFHTKKNGENILIKVEEAGGTVYNHTYSLEYNGKLYYPLSHSELMTTLKEINNE